jgi:hypothetical protein
VYDAKAAKVYSKQYNISTPYENMKVDLRKNAKGLYYVELIGSDGKKIAASTVTVL